MLLSETVQDSSYEAINDRDLAGFAARLGKWRQRD
jgi:hypothetical protein